jgi:hypothetical protein
LAEGVAPRRLHGEDPELLKEFLKTVPPPMPRLYSGVLTETEVEMIAEFMKTSVFKCGLSDQPQSCEPAGTPLPSGGTQAWQAIYSVLSSPRCINCHPVVSPNLQVIYWSPKTNAGFPQDYPRQGDDHHPHYFTVVRGDITPSLDFPDLPSGTGIGTPYERCSFWHGNQNDAATGIPGPLIPKIPASGFGAWRWLQWPGSRPPACRSPAPSFAPSSRIRREMEIGA